MEGKKERNRNSRSLKTKSCNSVWNYDYINNSDIGYPECDILLSEKKENEVR